MKDEFEQFSNLFFKHVIAEAGEGFLFNIGNNLITTCKIKLAN